jgi:hypothetical protein
VARLVIAVALALLALPSTASADALSDCIYDHELDRRYSLAELKQAVDDIPTDHDEYGLCREVLTNAMHGGPESGDDAPPSPPASPEEQARRAEDARELAAITRQAGGDPPATGPERAADRDRGGALDLAAGDTLPTPLLVALVALGVVMVGAALAALRERPRSPSP